MPTSFGFAEEEVTSTLVLFSASIKETTAYLHVVQNIFDKFKISSLCLFARVNPVVTSEGL